MSRKNNHRLERLAFHLALDKTKADIHAKDAKRVLGHDLPEVATGDTLKLTYALSIEYWGDVAERLEAMNRILADTDVVVDISTQELKHGTCLIEEVFNRIATAKRLIAERHSAPEAHPLCQTCGLAPGRPRTDNGVAAGLHCDTCWQELVNDARKKSW